ncbi:MAG: methyltransferase domain-containing protein [Candidatus Eisenbacteria bacterium]
MTRGHMPDTWEQGDPYEQYIGRWSRQIAPLFLSWLAQPTDRRWLDVGCGTGALSATVLERCAPSSLIAVEPSEGFRLRATRSLGSSVRVLPGDAASLPVDPSSCDVVISGLVLNFVPDLPKALAEMTRVTAPGGTIAAYVWDYADRMEITKVFWDAAAALDPAAAPLHEAARFPICGPAALGGAFDRAGLQGVDTTALELIAEFTDFEDYWRPFLGGQGPAPAYAMSLSEERRAALRARLLADLPIRADGTVRLRARAWAVRGTKRVVA